MLRGLCYNTPMTIGEAISNLIPSFQSSVWPQILDHLVILSPIILAAVLARMFWTLWMQYVRAQFFFSQKYSTLEVRLPKDLYKSPLAMELFLNSLHSPSDGNWYEQIWLGKTRPVVSLEMISIEGQVKFFIWLRESAKTNVQTALYAIFPGIEVYEREDYTRAATYDPETEKIWATEFKFTKKEATNSYPIKTYIDYGLDKDPKEEFKVDPLVPLLEFLGSIGPNQQVWIQIIIQGHAKDTLKAGHLWKKSDHWKDEAEAEVNRILMRDSKSKVSGDQIFDKDGKATGFTKSPTVSKGEQEIVAALERSVAKPPFDVGIRALYMAQKDFFNASNIAGIIGNFKHFNSEHLNGFKPGGPWMGKIEYPWQDYKDIRRKKMSRRVLMAYKRRSYFHPPFKGKVMVMNTEELATIFHFPGAVASTPTLGRIPSKKSEAPANLPI